jgi:hypothetical protein
MKKITSRKRDLFTARIPRLLRVKRSFDELPGAKELTLTVIPTSNQQKRAETAWLGVERKKAEALAELQRRHAIY